MLKVRLERGDANEFLLSRTPLISNVDTEPTVVSEERAAAVKGSFQRTNLSAKQRERRKQHKLRKGDS